MNFHKDLFGWNKTQGSPLVVPEPGFDSEKALIALGVCFGQARALARLGKRVSRKLAGFD